MVALGEVELPAGEMMVLDPGLARAWHHDTETRTPRASDAATTAATTTDAATTDLAVVGPDARAAGSAFDHSFVPERIYDVSNVDKVTQLFVAHCKRHGFDARLEPLAAKVPHLERARLALDNGGGLGVVEFNRVWGVVVGGLPASRALSVVGHVLDGEFAGRYRSIDIVVDAAAATAHTHSVMGAMVEHGQLLCVGLGLLGHLSAHDHAAQLEAQIRARRDRAGSLVLGGSRACGCDSLWGDGVFSVARELDAAGRVVRVRLDVGSAEVQARTRRVMSCLVSKHLLVDGAEPAFAAREEPDGWYNGWIFFSEHEDEELPDFGEDPDNWRAMPLQQLVERFPQLDAIVDTPPECEFELDADGRKYHRVDQ